MPIPKAVFVFGAGASREVNLPDGGQLTKKISSLLNFSFNNYTRTNGDAVIHESLRLHVQRSNPPVDVGRYIEAAWAIRDAMPQAKSIDNYIDHHNNNKYIEFVGKLAITRAVLEAETNSLLYVNPTSSKSQPNFSALSPTWFNGFFQMLTENCRFHDLKERVASVDMIVFNYDRCIEQFLYYSFQNYCKLSPDQAAELVNSMAIYHPYGVVGNLHWQKRKPAVEFGDTPSGTRLLELATQIKTFTEGTDKNSSEIVAIRKKIKDAKRLVFLGFAFHRLNLDLLFHEVRETKKTIGNCYATAYGISDSNCKLIQKELMNFTGWADHRVTVRNDLKCGELLKEYERSLSMVS
jgi:hypothetical protein